MPNIVNGIKLLNSKPAFRGQGCFLSLLFSFVLLLFVSAPNSLLVCLLLVSRFTSASSYSFGSGWVRRMVVVLVNVALTVVLFWLICDGNLAV